MKKTGVLIVTQCLLLLFIFLQPVARAQKGALRKAKVDSMLAAQQYTFLANFIQPMSGTQVTLTGESYSVVVTPDSVNCFLPYIGVAYVAPMNPQEGGIKFASVKFSYNTRKRKNGVWEISIKPEDVKDIQRLDFSIAPNGQTQLQVLRVTAQPVVFSGELEL
jgi:hypothetical protein